MEDRIGEMKIYCALFSLLREPGTMSKGTCIVVYSREYPLGICQATTDVLNRQTLSFIGFDAMFVIIGIPFREADTFLVRT